MNKELRTYRIYLDDMLISIDRIADYIQGMSFIEFTKDQKTVDAVIRNFEIIGEASKNIPSEIKEKHQQI